jgi:hypothetical protein
MYPDLPQADEIFDSRTKQTHSKFIDPIALPVCPASLATHIDFHNLLFIACRLDRVRRVHLRLTGKKETGT